MMLSLLLSLLTSNGETYLSREEAIKVVFRNGETVVERCVMLDDRARARVEERYGSPIGAAHDVLVAVKDGNPVGYAMILTERTKTMNVVFIVGVDLKGAATDVAVLRHDEHIGTDCRKDRFLDQFDGRTNDSRITVPGTIKHYSGATLSCQAVARGVRKALAVVTCHFLDPQDGMIRQQRYLMGTLCTITAPDREAIEKAFDEIKRVDAALSNWRDDSELAELHGKRSLKAGAELLSFFKQSVAASERSGGAFDVTVGPLVRLWGGKRVPPREKLEAARAKVGWKRIRIDAETVSLEDGVEIDPGGIGKGIAVDRAAEALRKAGVKRALVDFGSSAFAIGEWEISIRDPAAPDKALLSVALRDESLSTSGQYEKFFEQDGKRYGHILDPRTGAPVEGMAGVSVIAPTGTESDALSTTVFVLKRIPEKVEALLVPEKGGRSGTGRFEKK